MWTTRRAVPYTIHNRIQDHVIVVHQSYENALGETIATFWNQRLVSPRWRSIIVECGYWFPEGIHGISWTNVYSFCIATNVTRVSSSEADLIEFPERFVSVPPPPLHFERQQPSGDPWVAPLQVLCPANFQFICRSWHTPTVIHEVKKEKGNQGQTRKKWMKKKKGKKRREKRERENLRNFKGKIEFKKK